MTAITEARTLADAHTAYKAGLRKLFDPADGFPYPYPPEAAELDEEMRLWYCRQVVLRDGITSSDMTPDQKRACPDRITAGGRVTAVPRKLHEQLAHPNDDGTITCQGSCGQTKPVKKFPTAKGGIGRLSTCRECRDRAIAERKAGVGHG